MVEKTINEDGIQSDDIYNFDEIGFAIQVIKTRRGKVLLGIEGV